MKRSVFRVVLLQLVPRHLSFLWQAFTTSCVKMATPIHFIDGNCRMKINELKAGKSRKTCLTNRTRSISHHITPLVINGLGGVDTQTRIPTRGPKQFQETRRARPKAARAWFKNNKEIREKLLIKLANNVVYKYLPLHIN